jgi:phosphoenolpyruvate carboxylase
MTSLDIELAIKLKHQNQKIESALEVSEVDSQALLVLVADREQLVSDYLSQLAESDRKAFVEQELQTNQDLLSKVTPLFEQSQQVLSKFVKDAKAVRKYR